MRGFSLVELSIVLVILGLLTGGILAGQSLIRASELRAVSTEYQRYSAAINTFRDKYFGYPGDLRDATRFWGRLNTNGDCVSNAGLAAASAPGACDGNGTGTLTMSGLPAADTSTENLQFWRHLALAGLIEGTYTGLGRTGNGTAGGENIPRSKLSNAAWYIENLGNYTTGDANAFGLDYGTNLIFGTNNPGGIPTPAVLRPEEAWNIDMKMDDGRPAAGKVIAYFWNNLCATGAVSQTSYANATYNLGDGAVRCTLYFIKNFQ